ncbi:MAG: DUF4339 domain-containing protein [Pseudobdellovibrionaceae bacterium]
MKKSFFYQERGKTTGPATIDEMKRRIREGRLQLFDMVHQEGEAGWKMAMEYPDLRTEFKTGKLATMSHRPWVCLQRRPDKDLEFSTSGPFSTEDIRSAIQSGTIAYSDYAWKEGFSEWKRIGTIDEFNRRVQARAEEPKKEEALPPLPELPADKILENVTVMKRLNPLAEAPPPPEASGKDLSKEAQKKVELTHRVPPALDPTPPAPKVEPPPKVTRLLADSPQKTARPLPPVPSPAPTEEAVIRFQPDETLASDEITATNIKPLGPKYRRWVDIGIVVFLFLVMGATALLVTRYMDRSRAPKVDAPVVTEMSQPAPSKVEEKPELPPPRPEPAVPDTPPTELVLNVQTLSSTQVKIEIRSDSGPSFPIFVQIVGLPGQVSEGPSFYRYLKFSPSGNKSTPIDLSDVKLPQGKFILRAQTGKLTKEARMNIGINETQYKQVVGRLRKIHSASIWKERLTLLALAQILESRITEAAGGKNFGSKGLAALAAVKKSNGANYILFEQWWEMKEIMEAARIGASASLLARAKQARERISTFTVWK